MHSQALPIDWPSSCAPPLQGTSAAVDALAQIAAAWSLKDVQTAGGGAKAVPAVYLLPGDGDGDSSDADSTSD